jgi:hypothetical protein
MTEMQAIAALTGDAVLYRNLQPYDSSLPGLAELRVPLGLAPGVLPRKRDLDYGRVVWTIVQQMQAHRSSEPLRALLVVGDTDNDRFMAEHLRTASGLPVLAFIGADRPAEPADYSWQGNTATATRWALLDRWLAEGHSQAALPAAILPQTALLLDIDKTLLGPRGRNHQAIDAARAEAALLIAQDMLGSELDVSQFEEQYAALCHSEFHGLTLDNQDYTVFMALLATSSVLPLEAVRRGRDNGSLDSFGAVLAASAARMPPTLAALHAEIAAAYRAGDPTPFKAFRYAEFAATVARMRDGRLRLCREVLDFTRHMLAQGTLCLAASDKPAESALPSPAQAADGLLPLHRTAAYVG